MPHAILLHSHMSSSFGSSVENITSYNADSDNYEENFHNALNIDKSQITSVYGSISLLLEIIANNLDTFLYPVVGHNVY